MELGLEAERLTDSRAFAGRAQGVWASSRRAASGNKGWLAGWPAGCCCCGLTSSLMGLLTMHPLAVAVVCVLSTGQAVSKPIVLDGSQPGPEFDGHGGLSAGGTSRLLIEYPEPQRSEILDYLFLPNFGAAVQVLKLEIGGDTQSTDGTEASHMHFRGDLGCTRGYEGWLAKEAKKRNPDIKIWSLSWGVPGWIGNLSGSAPTYFCDDNIQYQISWLKCLKDTWGVDSDYLGLWNERPQGSTDYIESLRSTLESNGFGHVGITVEATWQELLRKALTDSKFNASIVAGSAHYPCNATTNSEAAFNASKKWWAGEDNTGGLGPDYHDLDRTGNWTGASCWGRKLSQHFIKMRATSTVAWSLIWAAAPGVSSDGSLATSRHGHGFLGNGFLNATEPWSGHYDVPPVLWINAHWHHFAQPGWRFLENATAEVTGGSGWLPGGGSYVTLVPPKGSEAHPADTFTLIVETLTGTCGKTCNTEPITETQALSFELTGPLASASRVALWCSSESAVFAKQPDVTVTRGTLRLSMKPDMICTATTLLTNGSKGVPTPYTIYLAYT
jgi:galactosylceramidase